jgi:hypothetical protein
VIVGHILSGPLDALIELGLPLLVFAGLWWWSTRGERKAKKDREQKK